jgi:hypothetical protein
LDIVVGCVGVCWCVVEVRLDSLADRLLLLLGGD